MSYNLTLTGSTLDQHEWEESLNDFAKLFSITPSEAERLMTIAPVVIKPNVDLHKANAIAKRIEACGLECFISPLSESSNDTETPVIEEIIPVVEQPIQANGFVAKLKRLFKRD